MAAVGAFYLLSQQASSESRAHLRAGRRDRRRCRQRAADLSRPATAGPAWSPAISRPRWPRWKACSTPQPGAPLVIIGQPDVPTSSIDNPIVVPKMLSFLTYAPLERGSQRPGRFPADEWPDNIPLLYYSYHIMVGLGTIFIALMALAAFCLWRGSFIERALDALDAAC